MPDPTRYMDHLRACDRICVFLASPYSRVCWQNLRTIQKHEINQELAKQKRFRFRCLLRSSICPKQLNLESSSSHSPFEGYSSNVACWLFLLCSKDLYLCWRHYWTTVTSKKCLWQCRMGRFHPTSLRNINVSGYGVGSLEATALSKSTYLSIAIARMLVIYVPLMNFGITLFYSELTTDYEIVLINIEFDSFDLTLETERTNHLVWFF